MSELTVADPNLLTRQDAERLTEGIRIALDRTARGLADLKVRVAEAYQRRADLALGYDSWADYARAEFGEQTQSLAAPIRRELVGYLSAEGMSSRAIAPAVGKDFSTVSRDIQRIEVLQDATPAPEPAPEPADATIATNEGVVIAETRHVEIAPEPAPRKVTGLDGKTYTPPKQKENPKPRRRSLVDDAYNANRELYKAVERIRDITADDRYTRNKADIQAALQPSIGLALAVLTDLANPQTKEDHNG